MPMTFTMVLLNDLWLDRYNEEPQKPDESEDEFRKRCATACAKHDPVEAVEVLTGRGWDQWTRDDVVKALAFDPNLKHTNPMMLIRCMREGL